MADDKRTRRPSSEVKEEKKAKFQASIEYHKAEITKLEQKIADLDKPTTRSSRKSIQTLIKELSSDPLTLAKVLTEAGNDQDKLKDLLIQAIDEKSK